MRPASSSRSQKSADLAEKYGHFLPCRRGSGCRPDADRHGRLGADVITLSAHKFGGPQGAWALSWSAPQPASSPPLMVGGGQENWRRGGTENVAAIAGLASRRRRPLRTRPIHRHFSALRDKFEDGLRAVCPATVIFGEGTDRLASIQFVSPFPALQRKPH
jgi:cysteine desulfurase